MAEPPDKRKKVDWSKEGLDSQRITPPDWPPFRSRFGSDDTDTKGIPQSLLDAILEVVAKTIEQAMTDVVIRHVGERIAPAIRPVSLEIALLRITIDNYWRNDAKQRRAASVKSQEITED